ncbi:MAG: deoxyribodipyrimidine photo-lyase [Chlorobiaceae bacterium]|nr:deoxyribodipyrimidine photo-lyase [Chlorobiaceae bacterium]
MIDQRRTRKLNLKADGLGPVVYWMSRDQRFRHNWALLYACHKANELGRPLEVIFTLAPCFLGASKRHYDFMFKGLREVETSLRDAGIPLTVLAGEPGQTISSYASHLGAGVVVTDFSPLKPVRDWKNRAAALLPCAFYEVDAHNIVPCWKASPRQEFAARTIRPKLEALRDTFLTTFPHPEAVYQPDTLSRPAVLWEEFADMIEADNSVIPVSDLEPGERAAEKRLRQFLDHGLDDYAKGRNDPNAGCVSGLSPYLHFGHASAQYAVYQASLSSSSQESRDSFIEELFVRRELAENYCFYNSNYDSFDGIPDWAKASLMNHAADHREYSYKAAQFDRAETHDPLWNAAQISLVETGIIHGYMRMYWAKKILEWSATPASAFDIALWLNDRYALDGRDPNGYTGIAWSIGGVHDRPWFDRPVYGKIRYMNASGCARKFDVPRYIASFSDKNNPA